MRVQQRWGWVTFWQHRLLRKRNALQYMHARTGLLRW